MDYRVILSKPALRDLGEIARYIAKDSPDAAERVGTELLDLAESLAVLPLRGAPLRTRPGVRRVLMAPYLVVYRVNEGTHEVRVLRFWHAKRNRSDLRLD